MGLSQSKQKAVLAHGECLMVVDEFRGGFREPNYYVVRWPTDSNVERGFCAIRDSYYRISGAFWEPPFAEYRDSTAILRSGINFSLVIAGQPINQGFSDVDDFLTSAGRMPLDNLYIDWFRLGTEYFEYYFEPLNPNQPNQIRVAGGKGARDMSGELVKFYHETHPNIPDGLELEVQQFLVDTLKSYPRFARRAAA